jgi:hypothetical protein
MTFRISMLCCYVECRYVHCGVLFIVKLSVLMLSVVLLNVILLRVIMLNVILLNVAFYFLLCLMSLGWVSLCWVSLFWMSRPFVCYVSFVAKVLLSVVQLNVAAPPIEFPAIGVVVAAPRLIKWQMLAHFFLLFIRCEISSGGRSLHFKTYYSSKCCHTVIN